MPSIRLDVPRNFTLPALYSATDTSTQTIALALKLGADAVTYLETRAATAIREETNSEAIAAITADFETKMKAATTKLSTDKARAEEGLRAAVQRIEAMDASAADLRSKLRSELKEQFTDIMQTKDEQIARLQLTLEKQMEAVATRMEGLQHSLTKTMSSSKSKGTLGEVQLEGFLKKAFDCDVQVVAKEAQTADIRMTRGQKAYFWEAKNYTRMVSSDEVEKFRRDMRLHPDVTGGCMVSLQTGIVGKGRAGDIEVEFLEDGRLILFISNLMAREDPVFYLQTLRPLFDTVEAMARPVKEDSEALRALQARGTLITNLLRSHTGIVAKHKNSLVGHRRRMDTMFADFQGYILESEAQLQTLLRAAMGDDAEQSTIQLELDTSLNAMVFKKERLSDCDERQKEFLKWLLGQAVPDEGSQIELKDLIEKAKPAFGDKAVRGFREDLFQESVWPKGARMITGLKWCA